MTEQKPPLALPYRNRADGGRALAALLTDYEQRDDVVVLALPRGGVPVGFEVAQHLRVRLDVFVVRKLGVPGHEELAMGAIATGGVTVLNEAVVQELGLSETIIEQATRRETRELERREQLYRDDRPPLNVLSQTVILVDDGLATGSTMRAAVQAVRQLQPACIVIAVPVASLETCAEFRHEVDKIVCAATPHPFEAVGLWYQDFSQTSDDEVRALLHEAWRE